MRARSGDPDTERSDVPNTYGAALSSWAMALGGGGPASKVAHVMLTKARRVSHARSRDERDTSGAITMHVYQQSRQPVVAPLAPL